MQNSTAKQSFDIILIMFGRGYFTLLSTEDCNCFGDGINVSSKDLRKHLLSALELLIKYLEKCLQQCNILQFCFSLNHGKLFAPPSAQKYVQSQTLRFTHCLRRILTLTVGKQEKRKLNETFSQIKSTTEQFFLKVLFLVGGQKSLYARGWGQAAKNICKPIGGKVL